MMKKIRAASLMVFFLLAIVPAGWAGTCEGERAVDPHAAHMRFHFQDPEMDYTFGSLILVSNGESKSPEIKRQTKLCIDGLSNPKKKLVITPAEEGAASHCVMENRSLMSHELFDWLDEVFSAVDATPLFAHLNSGPIQLSPCLRFAHEGS